MFWLCPNSANPNSWMTAIGCLSCCASVTGLPSGCSDPAIRGSCALSSGLRHSTNTFVDHPLPPLSCQPPGRPFGQRVYRRSSGPWLWLFRFSSNIPRLISCLVALLLCPVPLAGPTLFSLNTIPVISALHVIAGYSCYCQLTITIVLYTLHVPLC